MGDNLLRVYGYPSARQDDDFAFQRPGAGAVSQSSNIYPESYLSPAAGLLGVLLAGSLLGQRQRAVEPDAASYGGGQGDSDGYPGPQGGLLEQDSATAILVMFLRLW